MKFNKNEFGWEEKVSINTNELATKNDIPHYNETLITEISGDDYRFFLNNNYFNISALNIDETKSYIGKEMNSDEKHTYKFVYDKEADALICEDTLVNIYNHKSYDGTSFIDNVNSAVLTFNITTFDIEEETSGYFKLYEIDKLELDNNCLPDDISIRNSLTVGNRIGDIGEYSVSEGSKTTASGVDSHAEGGYTTASGEYSHAEGEHTIASSICSHAEGSWTEASGENSHTEGYSTTATGNNSHAEGEETTASGVASHAEGDGAEASGVDSHAEGGYTTASGDYSHAEGGSTIASGSNSHAEGESTTASGRYSHAEGHTTTTLGDSSHIEGKSSNLATDIIRDLSSSTDNNSIITKWETSKFSLAKGNGSHVEGKDNLALGNYSHAEGNTTMASGYISHAEGYSTIASGENSHAEGYYTKASGQQQHVQGKYNIVDTSYAHIVGNGSSETSRSNAHTLDWDGNAWYKGKLSQDGTPTEDKDLVTKKYVDDKAIVEQIPILRVNEDNKIIYVNCNEMGTYKKYFVPNKYANVYSFSFVYTNDDNTETEIVRVGGALTRDDFVLCSRNTSSQLILVLGNTDKYTYAKSTKTIATGLNGYLKIGNTAEFTPTSDYNPATKKYVDDSIANQPTFSFNDSGELVVTIGNVTKTFVPKQ